MTDTNPETPVSNGMPMFGLGTWQNDDRQQCVDSVRTALDMGYRHIDTAQAYGNEAAVGEGLADADVDREEVFLATKVWISNLDPEGVRKTTEQSLSRLGVESVDLLYVHWPARAYDAEETLSAFADLEDAGKIDRIGVSNFEPAHLDRAREVLGDGVFANQVELHPLLPQTELREYAADAGIELVAYSPLARGEVFENPTIRTVAEKHDVSPAQVSLAWVREKGVTAIPKATGREHLRDNLASLELELDAEDIDAIDAIEAVDRRVHPDFAPSSW
jgi:2,5-diketo-D-gluconate reductase B